MRNAREERRIRNGRGKGKNPVRRKGGEKNFLSFFIGIINYFLNELFTKPPPSAPPRLQHNHTRNPSPPPFIDSSHFSCDAMPPWKNSQPRDLLRHLNPSPKNLFPSFFCSCQQKKRKKRKEKGNSSPVESQLTKKPRRKLPRRLFVFFTPPLPEDLYNKSLEPVQALR